jgi:predicted HNH restriction endonuclease
MSNYYFVRLGRECEFASICFENGFIGVGYDLDTDLSPFLGGNSDDLKLKINSLWNYKLKVKTKGESINQSAVIYKLSEVIKVGDIIISQFNKDTFILGVVISNYEYNETNHLYHRRRVNWSDIKYQKNNLSEELQKSLSTSNTLTNVTKYESELESLLQLYAESLSNTNRTYFEGNRKLVTHTIIERSQELVIDSKAKYKSDNPTLPCQVCNFSFVEKYGKLGENFIEAHHVIPLSTFEGEHQVYINDLAMVCANCHRMLHKDYPMYDIDSLKKEIAKNS